MFVLSSGPARSVVRTLQSDGCSNVHGASGDVKETIVDSSAGRPPPVPTITAAQITPPTKATAVRIAVVRRKARRQLPLRTTRSGEAAGCTPLTARSRSSASRSSRTSDSFMVCSFHPKRRAQGPPSSGEMHSNGAVPHAEELCHLARFHAGPVPEHDRLALADRELTDGTKDLLPIQRPA